VSRGKRHRGQNVWSSRFKGRRTTPERRRESEARCARPRTRRGFFARREPGTEHNRGIVGNGGSLKQGPARRKRTDLLEKKRRHVDISPRRMVAKKRSALDEVDSARGVNRRAGRGVHRGSGDAPAQAMPWQWDTFYDGAGSKMHCKKRGASPIAFGSGRDTMPLILAENISQGDDFLRTPGDQPIPRKCRASGRSPPSRGARVRTAFAGRSLRLRGISGKECDCIISVKRGRFSTKSHANSLPIFCAHRSPGMRTCSAIVSRWAPRFGRVHGIHRSICEFEPKGRMGKYSARVFSM